MRRKCRDSTTARGDTEEKPESSQHEISRHQIIAGAQSLILSIARGLVPRVMTIVFRHGAVAAEVRIKRSCYGK